MAAWEAGLPEDMVGAGGEAEKGRESFPACKSLGKWLEGKRCKSVPVDSEDRD